MHMTIDQLVLKSRSFRRFDESHEISKETLKELIKLARNSPSGANRQPIKFHLSADKALNEKIFPHLVWAGFLKEWDGPEPGERPCAYISIVLDKSISQSAGVDHGIAAQSILLGATERGLGGCMIGSLQKQELGSVLELDDSRFEVILVIALGKPVEKVVIEDTDADGDIKYWRDAEGIHHVPKRPLEELILNP
jgi:nitroreductase